MGSDTSGRLQRLERTAKLIAALVRGDELTREKAAELLGVSLANADRQVAAVGRHFPLKREWRSGGKRVIRLDRTALLQPRNPPPLSAMIAVCLGSSVAPLFKGTEYEPGMREAVSAVIADTHHPEWFHDIARKFVFVTGGGEMALPDNRNLLDAIIEGLQRNNWLTFRYHHFGKGERRVRVQPLSLAVYQHQLYVVARERGKPPHPFRFSRIDRVDIHKERFEYPSKAEYDPDQLFSDSIGIFVDEKLPIEDVELNLDPRWWSFVKAHKWHRSQNAAQVDGRIRLRLHVRVCPELVSWILTFGPDAIVVRPRNLVDRIKNEVRRMAEVYAERTERPGPRR